MFPHLVITDARRLTGDLALSARPKAPVRRIK